MKRPSGERERLIRNSTAGGYAAFLTLRPLRSSARGDSHLPINLRFEGRAATHKEERHGNVKGLASPITNATARGRAWVSVELIARLARLASPATLWIRAKSRPFLFPSERPKQCPSQQGDGITRDPLSKSLPSFPLSPHLLFQKFRFESAARNS